MLSQYQKLFGLDQVNLEFTPEALREIAKKTIALHTGARGLRSVMEEFLTPLMYSVPSDYTIEKIVITTETVNGGAPELVHNADRKPVKIKITAPKKRGRKDTA